MCTCTHTAIHTHVYTHPRTVTHTPSCVCTRSSIYSHVHVHTWYTRVHSHAHVCTPTYAHVHDCLHVCVSTVCRESRRNRQACDLFVVPCGTPPPSPHQTLGSQSPEGSLRLGRQDCLGWSLLGAAAGGRVAPLELSLSPEVPCWSLKPTQAKRKVKIKPLFTYGNSTARGRNGSASSWFHSLLQKRHSRGWHLLGRGCRAADGPQTRGSCFLDLAGLGGGAVSPLPTFRGSPHVAQPGPLVTWPARGPGGGLHGAHMWLWPWMWP